jgi:hypothetical protein
MPSRRFHRIRESPGAVLGQKVSCSGRGVVFEPGRYVLPRALCLGRRRASLSQAILRRCQNFACNSSLLLQICLRCFSTDAGAPP